MSLLKMRNASWLAWFVAGLNIALMGTGLALQVITGSPMAGAPFLIHFSEVFSLSGFAIVGALIVSKHPWHPVGWPWLLVSISFGIDHFAWGYAYYGYIAYPGSLPGANAAIVWLYWLGRGTFGILGIRLATFSLFVRLRRARGVERQQIKWFVYTATFLPPAFILISSGRIAPGTNLLRLVGPILGVIAGIGISAASAIAIFRYRRWDIDVIVRRTLIFGLLSGTLALANPGYHRPTLLSSQVRRRENTR